MKAALALVAAAAATFSGSMFSPAHALNPIMHNSSSVGSSYWGGGWGNKPTSKYGQFTCTTCHTAGLAGGNLKSVKTTISTPDGSNWGSTGTPNASVTFTSYTTYGKDRTHTTSASVCEVCHSLTSHHRYNNPATNHNGTVDCTTSCHPHSVGFKPAGGSCTSCHGNPPTLSTYGGPDGLATQGAYGGNTNFLQSGQAGAHARHYTQLSMTCQACHTGYTSSPMGSGGVEIGFSVGSGTWPQFTGTALNYGSYTGNSNKAAGYSYVGRNGTVMGTLVANKNSCSVYCHGGWSGSGKTNPDWTGGAAAVACGKCHGTTPAAAPTRASHPKHASNGTTAYAISCTTCHPSRATGNTAHITGSVQWQLSTGNARVGATATYNAAASGSTGAAAPSATYANCTNVYCHSGDSSAGRSYKTVQWGATLAADCSGCHGNDAASAVPIASRAHKAHVNNASASYSGLKFKCNECHNTVVDATNRTLLAGAYGATGLHTNGGTPNVAWGTISNGGGAYAQGATNCGAIYCHSDGGGVYKTPGNWSTYTDSTEGTAACDYCHPGLAGNTTPVSSVKHTAHIRTSGFTIPHAVLKCANCHSRTARFNDSVYTNSTSQHISKTKNVRFSPYWGSVFTNHTGTFMGTTCDNTHCHGNVDAAWSGAGGQKTCGDCHSSKNDGLLSAPHTKHYNSATAPTTSNGWTNTKNGTGNTYVFYCGTCHNVNNLTNHVNGPPVAGQGGVELVFNIPGSQGAFTATPTKSGTGVVNDSRMFDYSPNTSCSVYCHGNANEAAPAYRAVTWGGAAKVCGDCHAFSKTPLASRDWSTKHEKHMKTYSSNSIFRCGTCHMGTVQNGTNTTILATSKRHVDGYRNVSSNATAGNFKYVPATKTCQSAYCHSAGRSGDTRYTNQTWTSAATTCLSCHGGRNAAQGTPVKSSAGFSLSTTHSQHLGKYPAANMNCNICHAKTASDAATLATYTGVRYHVNNKRDVHFTGITYGTFTSFKSTESGSGGNDKTCKNVSCHGGKTRSAWNTTTINNDNTCVHCHGTNGTTTAIANSGDNRKFFAPGWPKNSAGVANKGTDTDGEVSRANAQVGAHFAHLSSVVMKKIKCNECHIVPSTPFDGGHMAQPRFTLSQTLSFDQASSAKWNAVNSTTLAVFSGYTVGTAVSDPATCSSVYCHGYRLKNGTSNGTYRKPYWSYSGLTRTGTQTVKCGVCHGIPPNQVSDHTGKTINNCVDCHPAVVNSSGAIINKALHINRNIEAVAGDCLGCHNSIADDAGIPGTRREVVSELGGSSTKKSHHITSGTLSKWHCIVCHAEGDTSTGGTTTQHKNGTIELRNVDTPASYWSIPNTKAAADWTNVDNFCFGCHDSVGSAGIAFNGTAVTLSPTATQQQKPFNDNLTNSYDAVARNRVIDVSTQFTTTNYSHHAVKAAKYTAAGGLPFNAATILQGGTVDDNSRLHCHDCHYYNGHATTNNEYMLQNSTGADTLHTAGTYVCLKCHTSTYSTTGHTAGNGGDFVNGRSGSYNKTGMSCTACHNCGGVGWGGIHGGNYRYTPGTSPGWTYNSATETVSNAGTTQSTYRFMPGINNNGYSPANWTAASSAITCYTNPNASWGACTSHTGGKAATVTRAGGARALSY